MNETLSIVATGMAFDTDRLQVISHNLANVSTTAFKRNMLSRSAIPSVFDLQMSSLGAESYDETQAIDMRAGAFKSTSNPLDLAIEGPGFFEVKTPNGVAYSRAGDFKLDSKGTLVTPAGYAVMGMSGEIMLSTAHPVIDKTGQIFDKDKKVAQIKVVNFDDTSQLNYLGEGLYDGREARVANEQGLSRLRQGGLEASNVSSMHEMVKLIETMRHFESMQKIVQGWDSAQDTVVRKLGEF